MAPRSNILLFVLMIVIFVGIPSLRADWLKYGNPVCTAPGDQDRAIVVSDEAGGLVVAWQDRRTGSTNIYAQRLNATGDTLWPANGVALCNTANNKRYPTMVPDGTGGAIVIWEDDRQSDYEYDIYAQRIDGTGTRRWSADGEVICDTYGADAGRQKNHQIASDGAGGAIVTWNDSRTGDIYIYAQRINAGGTTIWDQNGIVIDARDYNPLQPEIVSDDAGGAIITWHWFGAIYAQRVDAAGDTLWPANGVLVSSTQTEQWEPTLAPDGSGGAIIVWEDRRNQNQRHMYAQRVNASGDTLWTHDGIVVCDNANNQTTASIVPDGGGGAFIVWAEGPNTDEDLRAQRVDGSGNLLWAPGGVDVCTAPNQQLQNQMIADGTGGAIIVWKDYRGAYARSYTQRLDANGNPLWTIDGTAIWYATIHFGWGPNITTDGAGGALFVWDAYSMETDNDIYAASLDATGQLVPIMLQSHNTVLRDGAIVVEWLLSSPASVEGFTVFRKDVTKQNIWEDIPVEIEGRSGPYSFTDDTCLPGSMYSYRVELADEDGRRILFETDPTRVPETSLALYQNTPNPFNPTTTISFYLPEAVQVDLSVFDAQGKRVRRLISQSLGHGRAQVTWDGLNDGGDAVGSGVYFCRLKAGKKVLTRKLTLLK